MWFTALVLEVLALVGGRVHSMVPGEAPRVATVWIESGKIVAVEGGDGGAGARELPSDARRVDASGLHLIPGLIDGLAYHDPEHELLYTAAGVTLVRDHGNELARVLEQKQREVRERSLGPELSIAGAVLDGVPPSTNSALIVRSAAEAERVLAALLREEIDFVAVQLQIPKEAWRKAIELAHRSGRQLWGPVPKAGTLADLLEAKQDGLLFLDAFLPPGASWDDVRAEEFASTVARVAAAGVRVTPLLRGNARLLEDPGQDARELARLGPQYAGLWKAELELRARTRSEGFAEKGGRVIAAQRALLAALHAAGVRLVPGSGAPHPWFMPGVGLHAELAEWQRAGLAPEEVLRLATAGAAEALELEDRGALAPGKVADLVALRADPAQGLEALAEIEFVVLRGKVLSRAELDRRLAELESFQARARELAAQPIEVEAPKLPEGSLLLEGRVENATVAGRVSAERWAIVRESDQALSFCGLRVAPGSSPEARVEVRVRQRLVEGKLASFEASVRTAGHELAVRGTVTAGQMRVERRIDGRFIDNQAARETLAAIDVGSVTTLLLLAHARGPGPLPILRFDEGLELEVVRWDLALEEDGDHVFRTPQGGRLASFATNGALRGAVEQKGSGTVQTISSESDALGGAGLPLPAEKRARVEEAERQRAAREASAKDPPSENGEGGGDDGRDGDDSDG